MATENSGLAGGAAPSASSGVGRSANASADSYIGSLISLTSKSEIRYEGVLYNINTDESSIGLKNVRSFGTEGRKKDGQQIPQSDKVYEYILFRGSDIKDLQVKSSPPANPPLATINNDPAIIQQSQYPRPGSTQSSFPSMGSISSLNDIGSHNAQVGLPGSNFPGNLPLYPPGGLGTWGTTQLPPNSSGSGYGMPMYWQGYYGPPNGLPHLHQQPLLRPPGLPLSSSLPPPMQFSNFNPSVPIAPPNLHVPMMATTLPDVSPPMLPPNVPYNLHAFSSSQISLPPPLQPPSSAPTEPLSNSLPNKPLGLLGAPTNITTTLPLLSPFVSSDDLASSTSNKRTTSAMTAQYQVPVLVSSGPPATDVSNQPLTAPAKLSLTGSSPPTSLSAHKDVEVVKVSSQAEPSPGYNSESKPPILPLPTSRPNPRPNGGHFNSRYSSRGRERGRGAGSSNDVAKFTEEFDFEAMNEKFNKDEVWGHLGKNRDGKDLDDYLQEEYDNEFAKLNAESMYNKDDFFDNLSCTTLHSNSQNGRTKFSEQMKLDTETFGEFSRNWGGRGGRGPPRGGRYYGGGYGRGGYGYAQGYNARGRGRGSGPPSRGM